MHVRASKSNWEKKKETALQQANKNLCKNAAEWDK